ncbi:hypothetical protein TSUD_273820 [Trifolium subterraneum]|uniref:Reverse transcriptase domain-containing protein n=1 Tax=Trifolium subterraneum TaxID=3900 RepID=A0A2Z6P9I0_TRISU|nr:hypothetical protein TSUD_273820 [Trifolium subterraneum]
MRQSFDPREDVDDILEGLSPKQGRPKRTKSYPPGAHRSVLSGPWSLDWLQDLNQKEVGVLFSASKKPHVGLRAAARHKKGDQEDVKRRKAGGVFRHTLSSLKKVARLPINDRNEVLKILKKTERRSRDKSETNWPRGVSNQASSGTTASSASVSNDRKHWVVMQGSEQVAAEDVREVGKAIGVTLKGVNENMISGVEKRQEVRKLAGNQNPFLLCIQETKLQSCDVTVCSSLWGNSPHAFSFRPSVGASGVLLTLWDSSEVEVWESKSYEYVLWCHGRFIKSGEEFSVANVYAPCDPGAKQEQWDSLSTRIQALGRFRVCVCGDFNVVRRIEERRGWSFDESLGQVLAFWGVVLDLAKLYASSPDERVSDHCPLVMSVNEEEWGLRPMRMLKCWKDDPSYKLFVREKWNSFQVDDWGGFVLKEKFKMIKTALKDWHKTHTQNLPSRIESLQERLATLDEKGGEEDLTDLELAELHGVTSDIHTLSRLNASICWQQSRSRWLKEGDANTKYFHSVLASRRRGNAISSLQVGSTTVKGVAPIRNAVVSHFVSHFKAVIVDRSGVESLSFKRLHPAEVSSLILPFSMAEVKAAVWDCDSYKSPGPDGINFGFIKDFWTDIQGDVMRLITEFHRNGRLTKGLNATFIALIPKVESPQRLNDFRPISLVGSLYKIMAKVLGNRLRLVMDSVISESQTAFVRDRQILDGILIANEVVDEARRAKKELMLFKVDFEKAKWIRECICTTTASVLVNGSPTDEFPLERGLRQGDPLSPFLFLLAAEGLHVLMEAMEEQRLFTGYSVGETTPLSVTHLQFADDTLLLGTKIWANVQALWVVLVLFVTMSGLKVNFNKSMLVGVNIPDSWLGEAASTLCCRVGKIPFLYLGLPIGGDPRRLSFWEPVLTRLKSHLSGWKSRFLSFGGRLVLLKSVLTSLPVYARSFFKAPSGSIRSFCPVYDFSRWYESMSFFYATHMASLRVVASEE